MGEIDAVDLWSEFSRQPDSHYGNNYSKPHTRIDELERRVFASSSSWGSEGP